MSTSLDMDRIAERLGAQRRGKVAARGGYFGAMQVAAEVASRFRVPEGGGASTDPSWSEQRLVRLSPKTLPPTGKTGRTVSSQSDAGGGDPARKRRSYGIVR